MLSSLTVARLIDIGGNRRDRRGVIDPLLSLRRPLRFQSWDPDYPDRSLVPLETGEWRTGREVTKRCRWNITGAVKIGIS